MYVAGLRVFLFASSLLVAGLGALSPAQTLSAGPFHISGIENASTCLAVQGASTNPAAMLEMEQCRNASNQSWTLVPVQVYGTTGYQLVTGVTGFCADIATASTQNGAPALQWPCMGSYHLNQIWQLTPFGNAYQLTSLNSGKCLDIPGGNSAAGAQLDQWQCYNGGNANQLVRLTSVSSTPSDATSTALQATPTTSRSGQTVALTATVTSALGIAGGTVSFMDGSVLLATATLDNTGTADMSTTALAAGTHALTVVYAGTASFGGSTSPATNVTVVAEQASQSDAFVDSIGFVTHLGYLDTPYYSLWPTVLAELKKSGVRHVRDGFYNWDSSSPIVQEHLQLAAAGVGTTYSVPVAYVTTPQTMQSFAERVGDFEMIEPANECDVSNCNGTGLAGVSEVVSSLPSLEAASKLMQRPLLAPSFVNWSSYPAAGDLSQLVNYNNLHVYFGGRLPESQGWGGADAQGHGYGSLDWWLDQANIDTPNLPSIITESGYLTATSPTPFSVPESVEAAYTPRTLLTAFNKGIKRTFLYELIEEATSGTYGLLRADGTEKPAFTAVVNLVGLLSDKGTSFTPGQLDYTLTGGDSTVQHTLLQKRDGSFWLVLWLAASPYDTLNAVPTPVTPQSVTIHVNGGQHAKKIYWLTGTGALQNTGLPSSTSDQVVTLNENVTVLEVAP